MRASRLLQILLLLQNRGRLTATELAMELEVAKRTILRDVDALTEAGLPMIVHRGRSGGIELGFNYRTRLTGLDASEAEAIGLALAQPTPRLAELGLSAAAARARSKLMESFPDQTRKAVALAQSRFQTKSLDEGNSDERLPALVRAVRERRIVRLRATSKVPEAVHPVAMVHDGSSWHLVNNLSPQDQIPLARWGDINISSKTF